jgi:hypothetical protein
VMKKTNISKLRDAAATVGLRHYMKDME